MIHLVSQCEDAPEWARHLIGENFDTDIAELRKGRQSKMVVKSSYDLIFVEFSCDTSLMKNPSESIQFSSIV